MDNAKSEEVYKAIAYYRLSKDDGNNQESDSITNQRRLIQEYVQNKPAIEIVDEAYDDGYTGTNFERPGFKKVLSAIYSGRVNCVIVKDLSRLGREYIETGKYLEMIFPSFGVRFIAINDDVDSLKTNSNNDILIPVKNIMNESYCRELSKKLRRQFRMQRESGEYVGAFACYGYKKSLEDRHKIVIDEYASEIVKMIFEMKVKGYSQQAIADSLNSQTVLPPAEYKKRQGLNYKSGLQGSGEAKWNPVTIQNILTNPIYIGTLIQGKRGTPNYKVKQMRLRDEDQWVVVKNNHDAIIEENVFEEVQRILSRDTRTAHTVDAVLPLAGLVYCADCGRSMVKRSVTRGKKKFSYYVCSTNKKGEGCSSHSISISVLEETVMRAIKKQLQVLIEMKKMMEELKKGDLVSTKSKRLDILIAEKNQEIDKQKEFRMKLYEALRDELIDKDEYDLMRSRAAKSIDEASGEVRKLEEEKAKISDQEAQGTMWLEHLFKYENEVRLSREVAIAFIDRILIFKNKTIQIELNYQDELKSFGDIMERVRKEENANGTKK